MVQVLDTTDDHQSSAATGLVDEEAAAEPLIAWQRLRLETQLPPLLGESRIRKPLNSKASVQ